MKQRYLIAILPPTALTEEINQIRRACSQKFKVYKALRPPVHITLQFIRSLDESYEEKLINSLSEARNFKPFVQQLDNFSGFQNAKAVYISGTKTKEIENLHKQIKACTKAFSKDIFGSLTPHLTIAYRDVSSVLYEEILAYYKNESFHAQFVVNHFSLLKHDGSR
ncbi:2'-5' RNA ligase family protein [Pedobacter polysacchareus]|nr:2'-5' RNA ligase family protein [Pedobacter polysacchareus]